MFKYKYKLQGKMYNVQGKNTIPRATAPVYGYQVQGSMYIVQGKGY